MLYFTVVGKHVLHLARSWGRQQRERRHGEFDLHSCEDFLVLLVLMKKAALQVPRLSGSSFYPFGDLREQFEFPMELKVMARR